MRERTRPEQLHVELNAKERETLDLEQDNKPEGYFFIFLFFVRNFIGFYLVWLLSFLAFWPCYLGAFWLLGCLAFWLLSFWLYFLWLLWLWLSASSAFWLVASFPCFCVGPLFGFVMVFYTKKRVQSRKIGCVFLEIGSVPQFSLELIAFSSKLVVFPGNLWFFSKNRYGLFGVYIEICGFPRHGGVLLEIGVVFREMCVFLGVGCVFQWSCFSGNLLRFSSRKGHGPSQGVPRNWWCFLDTHCAGTIPGFTSRIHVFFACSVFPFWWCNWWCFPGGW